MRYDSLPVHKQSLGRFPAHYTHYTIETTDPGAISDVICDTVLSRHYSYHHIRHRIIITVSRGWRPRVMSLSPSLTQSPPDQGHHYCGQCPNICSRSHHWHRFQSLTSQLSAHLRPSSQVKLSLWSC